MRVSPNPNPNPSPNPDSYQAALPCGGARRAGAASDEPHVLQRARPAAVRVEGELTLTLSLTLSKAVLASKLHIAIESGAGFGFV